LKKIALPEEKPKGHVHVSEDGLKLI